jgi:hypothetical protein
MTAHRCVVVDTVFQGLIQQIINSKVRINRMNL